MHGKLDEISRSIGSLETSVRELQRRMDENRELQSRRHDDNAAALRELSAKLDQHAESVEMIRPTVAALEMSRSKIATWASVGFAVCEGTGLEVGYERIALFAYADGRPGVEMRNAYCFEYHRAIWNVLGAAGVLACPGDHADALGLRAGEHLAGQQVVAGLGHPGQQRPDDRRMVTRRDSEPDVPVAEQRVLGADGDVGEQRHHQPRADRHPVDRRHDRLVTVDHVVD